MKDEIEYLSYTLDKFNEVIDDSKLKLSNLKKLYPNNYDAMLEEKFRLESQINSVERAKSTPYFARIDFESKTNNEKCYIGKLGVQDYDNNIITVDWRAPISSLYYDSNIGKCSYEAPDGLIEGNLTLKRQYTIENSKLINFNDVDTVSNDELLKPYLSVSADNRLKNIVSTIQREQNEIIREKLGKNLVIQGVAGSGKTTVALHRIAYLVYNNRDLYKPSDYMVIGPNKFFVNYISGILPDLDVNGVSEYTLEEVFEKYVNEDYTINNNLDKITDCDNISKIKTSLELKNKIDEYFKIIEILPNEDFKIKDEKIISKSIIKELYNEINPKYYKSIKSKIDRLILLLNKYVDANKESITANLIKRKVSGEVIAEFKNNINIYLKKYFKVLNLKIKNIYIDILNALNIDTREISNNRIDIEDIPPLIYIRYLLIGDNIFDNYKHIVIDEAQDYGEFAFYVLSKIFKNATFSVYGDLAQSLYSYRSIDNWECLNNIFKDLEILKLNKSYRTTIEIMEEANRINKKLNLTEAISVIRHGDKVEYTDKDLVYLINKLKENYKTIAVITKTQDEANNLYVALKDKIDINLINKNNLNYDNNINILPSYLSKGLEFDNVIIVDSFDKQNNIDLKLLYVSMTRALHKLLILSKVKG
jgi:DNA helicase-2/ATP-dependent DNA helicase PcrA